MNKTASSKADTSQTKKPAQSEPVQGIPEYGMFTAGKLSIFLGGSQARAPRSRRFPHERMLLIQRQRIASGLSTICGNRRFTRMLPKSGLIPKSTSPTARRRLQRQPENPQTAGLPPEVIQKALQAQAVLKEAPPLSKDQTSRLNKAIAGSGVYALILEKKKKAERISKISNDLQYYNDVLRNNGAVPGMTTSELNDKAQNLADEVEKLSTEVKDSDALIQAALPGLGVSSEEDLVARVEKDFPELFVQRARQIAQTQLDQNKSIVDAEIERFSAQKGKPQDIQGLRAAAAHLVRLAGEIDTLQNQLTTAKSGGGELLPGGVPEPGEMTSSYAEAEKLREQIWTKGQELEKQKTAYQLQYPVLYHNVDVSALATADDAQLESIVGGKLEKIKTSIDDTKANVADGTLKVWDLKDVMEMTIISLGLTADSPLLLAVNNYIKGKKTDEAILKLAIAAVGITAGIIATIATAGGGSPLLAAAAGGAAVGIGGAQLAESVQQFAAEAAASNVALDPRIADISKNEPDVFWIILDIMGIVFDVAEVIRIFRALKGPARALQSAGQVSGDATQAAEDAAKLKKLQEFENAANANLPAPAASRVIANAGRMVGKPAAGGIRGILEGIAEAGRRAAPTLDEIIENVIKRADPEVAKWVAANRNNIFWFKDIKTQLGYKEFQRLIKETPDMFTASGLEYGGKVFLNPAGLAGNSLETLSSYLVHEMVHVMQTKYAPGMHAFWKEFQAFKMQRIYLKQLPPNLVPPEMSGLLQMSDFELEIFILNAYKGTFRPGDQKTYIDAIKEAFALLAKSPVGSP